MKKSKEPQLDADHIKCNREELLKCDGLFPAWKMGVENAFEQLGISKIEPKLDEMIDSLEEQEA